MVFADLLQIAPIDGDVARPDLSGESECPKWYEQVSPAGFESFLRMSLGRAANHSADGAIHFLCTNWPYLHQLLAATKEIYSEMKDLCVREQVSCRDGIILQIEA